MNVVACPQRFDPRRGRHALGLAALWALSLLVVSALLVACGSAAAEDFGTPAPGQRIYDHAGVLGASEIASLDKSATALTQAGAPVIVYLRRKDANTDETEDDARLLMQSWDVESSRGARDGLVIFFNLKPSDPRHGAAALYAGATHANGRLPQRELQSIYDTIMLPQLRNGDIAASITGALSAARQDLTTGPPVSAPPSAFERAVTAITGLPLLIAGILLTTLSLFFSVLTWRRQPRAPAQADPGSVMSAPSDLSPALAGALARGRVDQSQLLATVLDLAKQGAVTMESTSGSFGQQHVSLRLLPEGRPLSGLDAEVYQLLRQLAGEGGVISANKLARLRSAWKPLADSLRADLISRGWFDPTMSLRRNRLSLVGLFLTMLAIIGIIAAAAVQQGPGILGGLILFGGAMAAFVVAGTLRETTEEGERIAVSWRAYARSIKGEANRLRESGDLGAVNDLLDHAMPVVVAAGVAAGLAHILKQAGNAGYKPLWLGPGATYGESFFPVWVAFSGAISPASSASGSGAAAGGAAAGGSF